MKEKVEEAVFPHALSKPWFFVHCKNYRITKK